VKKTSLNIGRGLVFDLARKHSNSFVCTLEDAQHHQTFADYLYKKCSTASSKRSSTAVFIITVVDGVFMAISFADYAYTYYKKTAMIQEIDTEPK
jgi:hypothetical protein